MPPTTTESPPSLPIDWWSVAAIIVFYIIIALVGVGLRVAIARYRAAVGVAAANSGGAIAR